MSIIRSFAVGNGDMFYIKHGNDNFTIIDCQLFGDHKKWLVDELIQESSTKGITRFISTHPDQDHIEGIEYLDSRMPINNFYTVENKAIKEEETESFKHYCKLRDGEKAYYVYKGCTRNWMNKGSSERGSAGVNVLWPNVENAYFKDALKTAAEGGKANNISLVVRYSVGSLSYMWIGDLETDFMKNIVDDIDLKETTVVFAPHHGRDSGRIPHSWLDKLKPKIIVIGEAPSRHLNYYQGYSTLTQTRAKDITFKNEGDKIHCYSSCEDYEKRKWLDDENKSDTRFGVKGRDYYIGTLNI